MPDSRLRIIIDAQPGEARAALSALAADLYKSGAAADDVTAQQNKLALALAETQAAADRLSGAQQELNDNTDPSRTAALEMEVAQAQVALDGEARAALEAAADLRGLGEASGEAGQQTDRAKFSFTEFNSAISIGRQAIQLAKQAYQEVIQPVIDYTDQVRNLSRTIGASTEESSKLIQAADDVFVSYDSLANGLEAAIRKGVRPSIEGIGELSDAYLAIQDPIARTKFLMDNFGRSGADLAPLMEKGAAGIRELGDNAQEAGLVMSQDGVNGALALKQALDSLDDTLLGLKIEFASGAIPAIKDFATATEEGLRLTRLMKEAQDAGVMSAVEAQVIGAQVTYGLVTRSAAIQEISRRLADNSAMQQDNNAHVKAWQAANLEAEKAVRDTASATREMNQALTETGKAAPGAAEGLRQVGTAIGGDLNFGTSFEQATRYSGEFIDKLDKLVTQVQKYERASGTAYPPAENFDRLMLDSAVAADNYQDKINKLGEAQVKLSENTDPDKQFALESAVRKAEQAVDDSNTKMGEAQTAAQNAAGGTANYTAAIEKTRQAIHDLLMERFEDGLVKQAEALAAIEAPTQAQASAYDAVMSTLKSLDPVMAHHLEVSQNISQVQDILADTLAKYPQLAPAATAAMNDYIKRIEQGVTPAQALFEFMVDINGAKFPAVKADLDANVTAPMETAAGKTQLLIDKINGIPAEARVDVGVYITEHRQKDDIYDPLHGASGLDMIVPPGYSGDNFPIMARTGERVRITAPGQDEPPAQAPAGDTIIINDRKSLALWWELRRQAQNAYADSLM